MIYQNYYSPAFPNFVYQKHGKTWVKRKKGSKDKWVVAPFNEQSALQDLHRVRFLSQYNLAIRLAILGIVVYGGYKAFQYAKNQSSSTKSNSPT